MFFKFWPNQIRQLSASNHNWLYHCFGDAISIAIGRTERTTMIRDRARFIGAFVPFVTDAIAIAIVIGAAIKLLITEYIGAFVHVIRDAIFVAVVERATFVFLHARHIGAFVVFVTDEGYLMSSE